MIIRSVETLRLGEFPNLVWVVIEDAEGNRGTGESFYLPTRPRPTSTTPPRPC